MKIDCTACEMYETHHCDDCLVMAVLHPPGGPLEIDESLDPSIKALSGAGLIPVLKFRPRRDPPAEQAQQAEQAEQAG